MYLFPSGLRKNLHFLFFLKLTLFTFGEPFLTPNDPFIRHEIRLLSDEGASMVCKIAGLWIWVELIWAYRNLNTTANFSTIFFRMSRIPDGLPYLQQLAWLMIELLHAGLARNQDPVLPPMHQSRG